MCADNESQKSDTRGARKLKLEGPMLAHMVVTHVTEQGSRRTTHYVVCPPETAQYNK